MVLLVKVPNEPFVTTVLFDCLRHSALLRTIINTFYETDGLHALRAEENIYKGKNDVRVKLKENVRWVFSDRLSDFLSIGHGRSEVVTRIYRFGSSETNVFGECRTLDVMLIVCSSSCVFCSTTNIWKR